MRYFFDVCDEAGLTRDECGVEFSSRKDATAAGARLLLDVGREAKAPIPWTFFVTVRDEQGWSTRLDITVALNN